MQWIAPSEKEAASGTVEKRLWNSADPLRASSGLNAQARDLAAAHAPNVARITET
jgi:hypothetical protein